MRRVGYTGPAAVGFFLVAAAASCWVGARELVALHHASKKGPAVLAGLERAARVAPDPWRYERSLGRLLLSVGQVEPARRRYMTALDSYPGCAPCWIGLAEADAALHKDPLPALDRAVAYGRSSTPVRTRAAVLYAKMGMHEHAAREFGAALGGRTDDRQEFYTLLGRLYDADFVLANVLEPSDLPSYFWYARRELAAEQVIDIWQRMRAHGFGDSERAGYVDYLLKSGRAHGAWDAAFEDDAPALGTVLAGDFESSREADGWGWRVVDGEGVRARVSFCRDCASGSRALRLQFDGDHNPNYFGTSAIVAVRPARAYTLHARAKYSGLTSASGPSLMVRGLARASSRPTCVFKADGEPHLGDSHGWVDVAVSFVVPADCEGIRILVGRAATRKLNRYIGGELWIDDVRLEELPTAGAEPAEPALAAPTALPS